MKYEFATRNEKRHPQRMSSLSVKPKPLPNGPAITVDKCAICMRSKIVSPWECKECLKEDTMMYIGPQLPEDRSGEPETFYLGKEKTMIKLNFILARPAKSGGGDRYEHGVKDDRDHMVIYIPQDISRREGAIQKSFIVTIE